MRKEVVSSQWSVVVEREAGGRSVRAAGGRLCFICLLLVAYCSLSFAQGRIYNGTAPLYSPRPELGPTGTGMPQALREV